MWNQKQFWCQEIVNGHLEVLIKWSSLPNEDDTWENFDQIQAAFPAFHLEDKV